MSKLIIPKIEITEGDLSVSIQCVCGVKDVSHINLRQDKAWFHWKDLENQEVPYWQCKECLRMYSFQYNIQIVRCLQEEKKNTTPTENEMSDHPKLRPVLVGNHKDPKSQRQARFHCWGHYSDGDGTITGGIVEFEDGTCDWRHPSWIQFTDKEE